MVVLASETMEVQRSSQVGKKEVLSLCDPDSVARVLPAHQLVLAPDIARSACASQLSFSVCVQLGRRVSAPVGRAVVSDAACLLVQQAPTALAAGGVAGTVGLVTQQLSFCGSIQTVRSLSG